MSFELEMGMVMKDNADITGVQNLLGNKAVENFFVVGDQQKNYYPQQDESNVPVEIQLRLGKKAHAYR